MTSAFSDQGPEFSEFFDSIRDKDDDSKASIQSLGGSGVQLFVCLLEEIFTTSVTFLTEPDHRTLEKLGFPLSDDG